MKKIDIDWEVLPYVIGLIVLVLILITCIVLSIYCFVTYGGLPIQQVPSWALYFMFGKR